MRRRTRGADVLIDDTKSTSRIQTIGRRKKPDNAKANDGVVMGRTTAALLEDDVAHEVALPMRKHNAPSSRKALAAAKDQSDPAVEDQQPPVKKKRKQRTKGHVAPLEEDKEMADMPARKPSPVKKQRRAARLQEAAARDIGEAEAEPRPMPAGMAGPVSVPETEARDGAQLDESDDAAPEEVSLAAGRSEAAAQRAAEREVRTQQRADAKEKGRRRAALAEAQREARLAAEKEPLVVAAANAGAMGTEAGDDHQEDQEDFLPQNVIDALSKRSREQDAAEPGERKLASRELADGKQQQAARAKARKPVAHSRQVGPAFVQVLSKIPDLHASESALAFRRSRLQGPGVRRSDEMLVPTSSKYFGPAVAFA